MIIIIKVECISWEILRGTFLDCKVGIDQLLKVLLRSSFYYLCASILFLPIEYIFIRTPTKRQWFETFYLKRLWHFPRNCWKWIFVFFTVIYIWKRSWRFVRRDCDILQETVESRFILLQIPKSSEVNINFTVYIK